MKFLALTNSDRMAIVDDQFAEQLSKYSWHLTKPDGKTTYARAFINGESLFLHRVVSRLVGIDGQTIDHINRNGLDNRQANLRSATFAQNSWNAERKRGASGHRGVLKSGDGWVVRIVCNKVCRYFGYYRDLGEARQVADAAFIELRKEFDLSQSAAMAANN